MAIQASGAITLQDIQDEFGGSHPISVSEYYGSDTVPASGQISLSDFYGTQSAFSLNVTTGIDGASTLSTLATAAGWDGTVPIIMTISSGVHIRSMSSSTPSLTLDVANSVLINNGAIFGRGGNSNSGAGGHAISITATGITVTNNTGAFIAGGGGGGGGVGGGGGAGQSAYNTASNNGSTTGYLSYGGLNRTNGSASGFTCAITVQGGTGGDQGGGGVIPATTYASCSGQSCGSFYGGGCSTVTISGSASNNPAQGGSVLSATSNTDGANTNGGGGWGRSGENGGGAGGYAINTSLSYTYTNNGHVFGSL